MKSLTKPAVGLFAIVNLAGPVSAVTWEYEATSAWTLPSPDVGTTDEFENWNHVKRYDMVIDPAGNILQVGSRRRHHFQAGQPGRLDPDQYRSDQPRDRCARRHHQDGRGGRRESLCASELAPAGQQLVVVSLVDADRWRSQSGLHSLRYPQPHHPDQTGRHD